MKWVIRLSKKKLIYSDFKNDVANILTQNYLKTEYIIKSTLMLGAHNVCKPLQVDIVRRILQIKRKRTIAPTAQL